MTPEQFEALLTLWGRIYGESRPPEWDEPNGSSPIARLQKPPKDARHVPEAWRKGTVRQQMMSAAAGQRVPSWAVEPVVGSNSRGGSAPEHDLRESPEIRAMQAAWLALRRFHAKHAEVVRVNYQVRGLRQVEKATGLKMSRAAFQTALESGRLWIHGHLTA